MSCSKLLNKSGTLRRKYRNLWNLLILFNSAIAVSYAGEVDCLACYYKPKYVSNNTVISAAIELGKCAR